MLTTGPFNATRHAQKPLPQPNYNFGTVPKARPTLAGSVLTGIANREHFHECMAEMLLLCKEAMRRRPLAGGTGGAKPLSLEYLADRLDIDDPCFGYIVRTDDAKMQGFITATTFTNWQRSFQWDSGNEAAYDCDSEDLHEARHERKLDVNCELSKQLQATVRCGDINMEGIVWPRICEISLLGGLGCGATLIHLIIEELECRKGSAKSNYDFVVMQATDNSIPFYESVGFVRVGAVMLEDEALSQEKKKLEASREDVESLSPKSVDPDECPFVTSDVVSYTVRMNETLNRIAAKYRVDVWDIIFLNRHLLGDDAIPSSKPKLKSILMLPAPQDNPDEESTAAAEEKFSPNDVKWYVAKENDTPRMIAKMYDVSSKELVSANVGKLDGLMANSRLKEGTRIKVSHLDVPEINYEAYAHWSFPDARFEDPEPSYMMVRKLNRRNGNKRSNRPVENALSVKVLTEYKRSELLLPASPTPTPPLKLKKCKPMPLKSVHEGKKRSRQSMGAAAVRPKTAYQIFVMEQRELAGDDLQDLAPCEVADVFRDLWDNLLPSIKAGYEEDAEHARENHKTANNCEEVETPSLRLPVSNSNATIEPDIRYSLYNKVVRLKPGAMQEGLEYTYYYVLTFIPDLKWCHLAPMVASGKFGADKPKAEGRTRWKLVNENLGKELDISSSYCIPITSKSMCRTLDADREEWNIIDDGTDPTFPPKTPRPSETGHRKRKRDENTLALLKAVLPGKKTVLVQIVGPDTFVGADVSVFKKRGRPIGSKDVVKRQPRSPESHGGKKSKHSVSLRPTPNGLQRRMSILAALEAESKKSSDSVKSDASVSSNDEDANESDAYESDAQSTCAVVTSMSPPAAAASNRTPRSSPRRKKLGPHSERRLSPRFSRLSPTAEQPSPSPLSHPSPSRSVQSNRKSPRSVNTPKYYLNESDSKQDLFNAKANKREEEETPTQRCDTAVKRRLSSRKEKIPKKPAARRVVHADRHKYRTKKSPLLSSPRNRRRSRRDGSKVSPYASPR